MNERRKQERKSLMAYTQVYDLYGGRLLGYLGDLTEYGLMVIGDKPIEENIEITLAIEIPDLKEFQTARMTMPARAVWVKQDISPEYVNIGFEFKQVTAEQKKIINAIIENYEFRRDVPKYNDRPYEE